MNLYYMIIIYQFYMEIKQKQKFILKQMKSREHVVTNGRAVFYACLWEDFRKSALLTPGTS